MAASEGDELKAVRLAPKLLCSSCQSAKFMRWRADDAVGMDRPHGMHKDAATGMWYVLRCDYFRLTVFEPPSLAHCDAWKEKGGGE